MLAHPSLFLFYGFLVFSVLVVLSSDSWFMVWVGLEINVVSFIPLMLVKGNKYRSEARVKYFLIQAFASVLIMMGALLKVCDWALAEQLLAGGVLLKIGAAPFHQWLPSLVEGVSWGCLIVLFILQKVGPLVGLSLLLKTRPHYALLYGTIICCSLIGRVGGLMRPSLRKIMAYSSITHLGWAISSMLFSDLVWVGYYFIYGLVVARAVALFHKEAAFSLNQLMLRSSKARGLMGARLLSLGGLPPFRGFVPKFLVRVGLLEHGVYFLFVMLLRGTFLRLFFYIRVVLRGLVLRRKCTGLFGGAGVDSGVVWLNAVGLLGPSVIFFSLLDFKLSKLWAFKAWKIHV